MSGDLASCIIDPWPWQWGHDNVQRYYTTDNHTHYHFTPLPQRLSDEDVERVAKRVVEILKGAV